LSTWQLDILEHEIETTKYTPNHLLLQTCQISVGDGQPVFLVGK
jgi:hypothetical protein